MGQWSMLGDTPTTRGRVPVQMRMQLQRKRDQEAAGALKQESVPGLGSSLTSQWCAQEGG
jgi:hypothetical protein